MHNNVSLSILFGISFRKVFRNFQVFINIWQVPSAVWLVCCVADTEPFH